MASKRSPGLIKNGRDSMWLNFFLEQKCACSKRAPKGSSVLSKNCRAHCNSVNYLLELLVNRPLSNFKGCATLKFVYKKKKNHKCSKGLIRLWARAQKGSSGSKGINFFQSKN